MHMHHTATQDAVGYEETDSSALCCMINSKYLVFWFDPLRDHILDKPFLNRAVLAV